MVEGSRAVLDDLNGCLGVVTVGVRAVLWRVVFRSPRVLFQVADAALAGGDPIWSWKCSDVKYVIRVATDQHVGV